MTLSICNAESLKYNYAHNYYIKIEHASMSVKTMSVSVAIYFESGAFYVRRTSYPA